MSDPVFVLTPTELVSDSRANPALVDIDGDRDLDAFVGNSAGNTSFFKNTGTASNPIFEAASINPFGLSNVGFNASPDFVDIDDDGDLDAFIGNFDGITLFFRNTGDRNNPIFSAPSANPFGLSDVGSLARPTFIDIDGDGDLDAFVGVGARYTFFFQNTGTADNPSFILNDSGAPFGLGSNRNSAPLNFVDIDGDGDLDAFLGMGHYSGSGGIIFFRNIGTASNPAFYRDSLNPFGLGSMGIYLSPEFVDIDDDGDIDSFIGLEHGSMFFENTSMASIPYFGGGMAFGSSNVMGGYNRTPVFVDIDGDGDLDAFVGKQNYYGESDGTIFFENTGTANRPISAAPVLNPFGLSDTGGYAIFTLVDIDNDDDLDAFASDDVGNNLFLENTGTTNNPAFSSPVTNPFGLPSHVNTYANTPHFVDIDGDGDLDTSVNNVFLRT